MYYSQPIIEKGTTNKKRTNVHLHNYLTKKMNLILFHIVDSRGASNNQVNKYIYIKPILFID